jgi:nucleoside-diphosphate-sugar epimerase
MKIALLGSSSQIAKGLLRNFVLDETNQLFLFTRDIVTHQEWLKSKQLNSEQCSINSLEDFNDSIKYDLIINFIGIGDPAKALKIGSSIFDITYEYDQRVLDYLLCHNESKYIFISSGVVYGNIFTQPANEDSHAIININSLKSTDWYSMAKIYAEARHRALDQLSITDIRVFNYVSSDIDIDSRFLISDALRAIINNEVLQTNNQNIFRDYIGYEDLYQLIMAIAMQDFVNTAVDCYTREATDKVSILQMLESNFGLRYEVIQSQSGVEAFGPRDNYFSLYKRAESFGYKPAYTSLENISKASEELLS